MYKYTVKVYEDTDLKIRHGLTYGSTYAEALNNVIEYYGEECIEVTIRFITENKVLHCPDEIAELIAKENDE